MTDIRFKTPDGVFNLCAIAVIIREGKVLMVKGSDSGKHYPVGGHVQLGETSEQAVVRECLEETGVNYEVERLLFVCEDFFTYDGQPSHSVEFYYLMKPNSAEPNRLTDNGEELVWLPVNAIDNLLFPEFFKTELQNLPDSVKHIIIWRD
ncbi:MAG: NUDIX domain-containing protein [Oscillospiraceae bacterium]|jgi:ADP-ribose pyrophosphatase YjhB (NUDIX family)|nr:NUDIX domain-containing protein [Oscillospiraceae bacterium]